jgi:hypothetical protein
MMRLKAIVGVVSVSVIIMLYACQGANELFKDTIDQGKVTYKVTYPEMEVDNMLASILPEEMNVTFKGNKYNSEFSTYGGIFKNKITVDSDNEQYSQMLKVFKKKLACQYDQVDIDELMQDFPPFVIIQSDIQDTLAGIPCKRAHGVFYDIGAEDIDIYYSEYIGVKNPNWCSPFDEVKGFLLGYDIDMFDIRMRLMAEEVVQAEIDKEEFIITDDYKRVSYKYIKVEIEKLMESFEI